MMKLSTILAVDSTVDIHGSSPIAEQILKPWDHEQGTVRFFRASANFIYRFRQEGKPCFLRFAAAEERTRATIEAEMDILQWVAERGMMVTTPLPSRNGNFVETVVTDLGTFHAVVFAQLQGSELDIVELRTSQFEVWGATLGKLHATLHLYQISRLATRPTWHDHLATVYSYLPPDELGVQAEYDHLASFLATLPMTEANYGLIHSDFELDNLFWQDGTLAMLDFDDCAYYWYVADIAFALRDLFVTGVDLSHPSFRAFTCGYTKHFYLDEELIAQLPTWMRLVKFLVFAKLVRAMDLSHEQNYPDSFTLLLLRLENRIRDYKASVSFRR